MWGVGSLTRRWGRCGEASFVRDFSLLSVSQSPNC